MPVLLKSKTPGTNSPGVKSFERLVRSGLNAERAAAAAGALHVGVVELEA
jgi:hypothetical protein